MRLYPGDCARAVAQEVWKADLGIEPMIGNDADNIIPRQRGAHEQVVFLSSAAPTAPVEEDDHRRSVCRCLSRQDDIEGLPGTAAVRNTARDRDALLRHRGVEEAGAATADPGEQSESQRKHETRGINGAHCFRD